MCWEMKMKAFVVLLLATSVLQACPSHAQTQDCSTITEKMERLRCQMKGIAEDTTVSADWEPPQKKWRLVFSDSEMTDEQGVYGSLDAEGSVSCGIPGMRRTPTLRLQCHENETRMLLDVGCFMADSAGFGEVRLRADGGKAKSISFRESADNEMLGLWGARAARPAIDYISEAKSLLVEFAPYREAKQTAEFKIDGIGTVVSAVRKQCGW